MNVKIVVELIVLEQRRTHDPLDERHDRHGGRGGVPKIGEAILVDNVEASEVEALIDLISTPPNA